MCGRTVCSFGPKCARKLCTRRELYLGKRGDKEDPDTNTSRVALPLFCCHLRSNPYHPSYNLVPGSYCAVLVSSKCKHISSLRVVEEKENEEEEEEGEDERENEEMHRVVKDKSNKAVSKGVSEEEKKDIEEVMTREIDEEMKEEMDEGIEKKEMEEAKKSTSTSEKMDEIHEVGYVIQPMRWGLVPSWHKGDLKDFGLKLNNTRVESLSKPMFKSLMGKKRCVVLADGFYEWKKEKNMKQPYFFFFEENGDIYDTLKREASQQGMTQKQDSQGSAGADGVVVKEEEGSEMKVKKEKDASQHGKRKLLTMAGLFDTWICRESKQPTYTFSIITVQVQHPPLSSIHHRMPAILRGEEIEKWLDWERYGPNEVQPLLRSTGDLSWHAVTPGVNSPSMDSLQCVKPFHPVTPEKEVKVEKRRSMSSAGVMEGWLSGGKKRKKEGEQ